MTRRMSLMAFMMTGPTGHHHGMWRHPETDNNFLEPYWYEHIARVLEQGCFDALFFADSLGLPETYRGTYETVIEKGGQMALLDPVPLLAIMAQATKHLGLGVTISTTFLQPYHLARVLATLDIISKGRIAWNVVTSTNNIAARNFGFDQLPSRNERYDRGDEVLEACEKLWSSFAPDTLIVDKESGTFADASKVKRADYNGKWIKTSGPLSVPRSPQGHPVIMQAGASARGREFAARWAEVVFTLQHAKKDMEVFYKEMKEAVVAAGRPPEHCAILTSVDPIIGETESIAKEKQDYINSLVDPELGLALMSYHVGTDLSRFPKDQPIGNIEVEQGARGALNVIMQGTKAHGLTLAEAAQRFATSEMCPQVVGTPEQIADQLQDYFEGGCDGFILTPTVSPGTFEAFSRSVVPILQKRGLMRKSYEHATLRENLRANSGMV